MAAAIVAAILTERGLGGDEIDLAHRLDNFRRDRSRRGEEARRMAARWAEMAVSSDPERVGQSPSPSFPPPLRGRDREGGKPHSAEFAAHPPPQPSPATSRACPTCA